MHALPAVNMRCFDDVILSLLLHVSVLYKFLDSGNCLFLSIMHLCIYVKNLRTISIFCYIQMEKFDKNIHSLRSLSCQRPIASSEESSPDSAF
jgi:hypothetical protein